MMLKILQKITVKLFIFSVSLVILSSCSLFEIEPEKPVEIIKAPPTEREIMLEQASNFDKMNLYDDALPIYLKIIRDSSQNTDEVYEQSLLGLAKIYEKSDQSEKAILALLELLKANSTVISKISLQVSLMKNHYRVTNYYQAQKIKNDIDEDYKVQNLKNSELFIALFNQTHFYYDRHIFDELLFVGDIQKYFIYLMEDRSLETSDKASNLLRLYYEKFLAQIDKPVLSKENKKKLAVSLLDQLNRFDRYKQLDSSESENSLWKFTQFAETHKRKLTERISNDNF